MTGQDDKRVNNHIVHTPLDIFTKSYEIGDLYDARDRTFLHMGRLFDTKAEEVREEVSKYEYLVDSNISTRIDKLGVSANMKADFLCGAVTVDGSASYASDDKEHVTRHTMHVILKGKTGTKKVDRSVYDLQETDLLLRGASCATHVITEIAMGYTVATTLSVSKEIGGAKTEAAKAHLELDPKGKLQQVVQKVVAAGAGDVNLDNLERVDKTFRDSVSVKIVGDLELGSLPHNLEDMSDFNRQLPEMVRKCNNGWGVPKKVYLAPLTHFEALKNPLHVSIANIKAGTLSDMSNLMVQLEGLLRRCEELQVFNENASTWSDYWSTGANSNLVSFQEEVQRQIVTIRSDLLPALNKLYLEDDESDVLQKLADYQHPSSECFTLRSEGDRWLSSVREHIQHLKTTAGFITSRPRLQDKSSVQLMWISPLSAMGLTTKLLVPHPPAVVLKVKESVRGSSAFSRDPPDLPYSIPDPAALVKLMKYATSHTKTQGAGLLTILAYDGHGVDQDDCGSAVHQIEDGRLVNLGPPPSPKAVETGSSKEDVIALMHIYQKMGGSGWTNKSGWEGGWDLSEWQGITVSADRADKLNLKNNNVVSDDITPALFRLRALVELDLSLNKKLAGRIPWTIQQLEDLELLQLSECSLTGVIPDTLANMNSLVYVDLSGNNLRGRIPDGLGLIKTLRKLWLHDNQLDGAIPASLGELPLLRTLVLEGNRLGGLIPPELGGLTKLRQLRLRGNKLQGEIPDELSKIVAMVHLDVSGNNLTGTLPAWLSKLPLQTLCFKDTRLKGAVSPGATTTVSGGKEGTKFEETLGEGVVVQEILVKPGAHAISGIQIQTSDGRSYNYGRFSAKHAGPAPEHRAVFEEGELVRSLHLFDSEAGDRLAGFELQTTHAIDVFSPSSGSKHGSPTNVNTGIGVITGWSGRMGWSVRGGGDIHAFGLSFAEGSGST